MRLAVVALPSLLVALLIPPQKSVRPAGDEGFSVVVTSTTNGWSLECEKGCDWKGEASFICDRGCSAALVDSRGIVTLGEIRGPDRVFQFIVRHEVHGVSAEARFGTHWKSLGWACADQPCRARVTESGVAPLR